MESKTSGRGASGLERKLAKAKISSRGARALPPRSARTPIAEAKHESKRAESSEDEDDEWEALKKKRKEQASALSSSGCFQEGETLISKDKRSKRICEGFRINWMCMRDADSGRVMWDSGDWSKMKLFKKERVAEIPKKILKCRAVSREINFSSREVLHKFRIVQNVYYNGMCMEEWDFTFGFVIPGSTNSWESTVVGAGEGNMIPPDLLSGRVTVETCFYDGDLLVSKSLFRIFYE